MAPVLTDVEKYLTDFQAFEQALPAGEAAWVRDLRRRGIARFQEVGLPTARKGNERWKYTNVGPIASATFHHPVAAPARTPAVAEFRDLLPWQEDWLRLVFVDGRFAPELSDTAGAPDGVRLDSLAAALTSDGQVAEQHLARYATPDIDGFTALNAAFLRDGALVHVPDGVELATPLLLVYLTTEHDSPVVTYPRTLVVLGRNAAVTLVEAYVGLAAGRYFTDAVTEVVLDEGARAHHYRYLREGAEAFHIGTTKVHQGRDSTFESVAFEMGCAIARNDVHVLLDDPGASCVLNGLYMTAGTQHMDNDINIDHLKPHCSSSQYWKGILAGRSRAVYSGRVVVHRDAQKTYATQADKNLLLSEEAEIDTKPSLFIYADDVQCTHGATAGHIDEDAYFYLRSRGLDAETASRLLINGFAREILDGISLAPLREYLDRLTSSSLPEFRFSERR
ncbi:MAG TPA: Fe-S cluster assembly protein SufD [Dehalococcoidia bacterium]